MSKTISFAILASRISKYVNQPHFDVAAKKKMPVAILGNLERHDTVVHDAIFGSEALKKLNFTYLYHKPGQLIAPLKPGVRPRHEQIVRHVGRRAFFA